MRVLFVGVNKPNPNLTNTAAIGLAEASKHLSVQSYYLPSITVVRQDLKSDLLPACIVDRGPVALGWTVRRQLGGSLT
jgi:hypothetical protein